MATTNSHSSPLSDVVRELDLNAPPPAPLDLLSTVSSLFARRQEKLHKERLTLQDAEEEAKFVAARAATRKRLQEEEEEEAEMLDRLERALVPTPRIKDTEPSKEEIEALVNKELAKEEQGPGLRRAKHETAEEYEKRMVALEYRVDCLDIIEKERKQKEPVHYVDGLPTNVVIIDRHFRPIPETPAGNFSCLQCEVLDRRCGRTSDNARICEACERLGRRCLVKHLWTQESKLMESWKFAKSQRYGYDNLKDERRKWVWRLRLRQKEKLKGFQPMPAWPEKKGSDVKTGQQNTPKRWQDYLRST
ncbi:hypothetical protein FVEN_g5389 [Fusarium venenatum]|uniref:Zn(2)-C6 fungal-type domain-containing protein n=1 Tax=Fusarium venenatum TaxID=56646 RepID=A0A2L2TBU4_9HYPO|nr:uncharacterized protein FVRRES_08531 [Fusarium venenatum]KAG8356681.1 hypothetical protein FVEN_g5389 [Fusarium venenatum]KAH6965300.1 hypothetical protein EDB82DRAFT_479662 [Fusarium venenatum]CEI68454.1 unnamed protein product [Fusarium venenatum]